MHVAGSARRQWLIASKMPARIVRYAALVFGLLCSPYSLALTDCSVSATPMVFGDFDPDGPDFDGDSGQITVSCRVVTAPIPGTVVYNIAFSPGNSGSYSPRRLQNGAYSLRYNLFTAITRSAGQIWGDGTAGTVLLSGQVSGFAQVGDTRATDHIIYGRIAGSQAPVAVGSYGDSLVITLSY